MKQSSMLTSNRILIPASQNERFIGLRNNSRPSAASQHMERGWREKREGKRNFPLLHPFAPRHPFPASHLPFPGHTWTVPRNLPRACWPCLFAVCYASLFTITFPILRRFFDKYDTACDTREL